jgi:hypothetical protein
MALDLAHDESKLLGGTQRDEVNPTDDRLPGGTEKGRQEVRLGAVGAR